MKEMIEYYSYEGEKLGCMEKSEMHKRMRLEFLKKGKVSIRHKHVRLIMMTSRGGVILQRRSKWKGDNPGMWDKTVGGHVRMGDEEDITILKECSEELGIPATVVPNKSFLETLKTTNLNILGVVTRLSYLDNYQSKRTSSGKKWVEPNMTQFYIGYYDGPIRFVDSESCGIQVVSLKELKEELEENPNHFTEDIKYIVDKFGKHLKPAPKPEQKTLND